MIRVAFVGCSAHSERTAHLPWLAPLRARGVEICFFVPGDEARDVDALRAAGARVHLWPVRRTGAGPLQARAVAALTRELRQAGCELVHSFGHRANLAAALAAPLAGAPVRIAHLTGAGSVFIGERPSMRQRAMRLALLTAWRGIVTGVGCVLLDNDEDRDLLPFAPPERLVATRGPGIDLGVFDPAAVRDEALAALRAQLALPTDAEVVLFTGRIIGDKGVRELVEASRALARTRPGLVVLLAGAPDPGNPSSLSAREVAALNVPPLRVLGEREDVRELLALADVVVNPSYREGLPRANLEAAAMQRPVVTCDVRGCRQTVDHGETGLLVPPRDAGALADAIAALLDDPARRRSMGARGRVWVAQRFGVEQVAEDLSILYRRLLVSRGASGRAGV